MNFQQSCPCHKRGSGRRARSRRNATTNRAASVRGTSSRFEVVSIEAEKSEDPYGKRQLGQRGAGTWPIYYQKPTSAFGWSFRRKGQAATAIMFAVTEALPTGESLRLSTPSPSIEELGPEFVADDQSSPLLTSRPITRPYPPAGSLKTSSTYSLVHRGGNRRNPFSEGMGRASGILILRSCSANLTVAIRKFPRSLTFRIGTSSVSDDASCSSLRNSGRMPISNLLSGGASTAASSGNDILFSPTFTAFPSRRQGMKFIAGEPIK